jgi:hypothetical protein
MVTLKMVTLYAVKMVKMVTLYAVALLGWGCDFLYRLEARSGHELADANQ